MKKDKASSTAGCFTSIFIFLLIFGLPMLLNLNIKKYKATFISIIFIVILIVLGVLEQARIKQRNKSNTKIQKFEEFKRPENKLPPYSVNQNAPRENPTRTIIDSERKYLIDLDYYSDPTSYDEEFYKAKNKGKIIDP